VADFGLAEAGFIASAVGTGVSALGAIGQSKAAAANASYQAQVAKNDQIIAQQNAQYASQAGAAATTRAQLKQRSEEGALGAAIAAGGIDPNTGSAKAVRSAQAETTELDTATTAQDAALRVYGFRTNATNFGAEATLREQEARQAPIAGLISGGSTLLSGWGGLSSRWRAWQDSTLDNGMFAGRGPLA
jgi:hypothetical protein